MSALERDDGVIVIPPGGGEIIGDAPDRRVEVLSDRDELHATWTRFGPGRDGAGRHIHREHADLFYVLEGELTLKLEGDAEATASAGELVHLPPMVVHGFRNGSDREVTYLNLHAPGCAFIPYMRGLRDGEEIAFDQHDPEGESVRPASDASIGGELSIAERSAGRETLLCDTDAIAVSVIDAEGRQGEHEPGAIDATTSHFVLDGEVELELGAQTVRAAQGTWIQIPAGVAYGLGFPGPARALTVGAPRSRVAPGSGT